MLYIIGLGLNEQGISIEGTAIVNKCHKIYLESYTVDFPYKIEELEKVIGKKIVKLGRSEVESSKLVKEAKKQDVALLVYGSPLFATTHISLIEEARKQKVKTEVIYNASVLDGIAGTGLQLYKFGKIASMPAWNAEKGYKPDSFADTILDNVKIKAHTLILCDIGLEFKAAISQLEEVIKNKGIKLDKIVVCSMLGTNKSRIYYNSIKELTKKKIELPFCIIIPSELHFLEKEVLESHF